MIWWDTELVVGWMVLGKEGIKKSVKLALAYETDVANLNALVSNPRTWLP